MVLIVRKRQEHSNEQTCVLEGSILQKYESYQNFELPNPLDQLVSSSFQTS